MCIYMCACVYKYVCIFIYIYIYIYVSVYKKTYIYIYTYNDPDWYVADSWIIPEVGSNPGDWPLNGIILRIVSG